MADSPVEWQEDELYGRYEIHLRVDVGTRPKMHAAAAAIRVLAQETLDVLGYELDVVYVIGSQRERKS